MPDTHARTHARAVIWAHYLGPFMYASPVFLAAILIYLLVLVGPAALPGFAVVVLAFPASFVVMRKVSAQVSVMGSFFFSFV